MRQLTGGIVQSALTDETVLPGPLVMVGVSAKPDQLTEADSVTPGLDASTDGDAVPRFIGACDDMNLTKAACAAIVCSCCRAVALSEPVCDKPVNIVAPSITATNIVTEATNGFFM